ncbi:DUF1156 domain-containing protein [Williamsia muralis]|uniref:DUF1156 domain-containing protein n=1 Tax=Williamsia marianensis TaxID=85044 RepID=UPI003F1789FD
MTNTKPRVLIEDWLPVAELGIESRRERAASSALPPLSYLHIWWARRPLVASAAVVLGGLMPSWSESLAAAFPDSAQLQSEMHYRQWFLHLVGIRGDVLAAHAEKEAAALTGTRLKHNPFTYKQAYRYTPEEADRALLHAVLTSTWGELPSVADPTAGGGSIPFTAARIGLPTLANDLNGVAASVLHASVALPARYGGDLNAPLKRWGDVLVGRITEALEEFFPAQPNEKVTRYIWANAVNCPRTGRLVPLLRDKWLRKGKGQEVAIRLVTERDGNSLTEPAFEIVSGQNVDRADAESGTIGRGTGVSPYDNLVIDGQYIKSEAQSGRMRQVLYAVVVSKLNGDTSFRAPTESDLAALRAAYGRLGKVRKDWEARGILPVEEIPAGTKTREPKNFGFGSWADMFTSRQLLVHGTFGAEFRNMIPEVHDDLGRERGDAVLFELAAMQGKALNWNSRLSSWNVNYQRMRSVFDSHNFAMKWTFAEMEGAHDIYGWALSQALKSYRDLSAMFDRGDMPTLTTADDTALTGVQVTRGNAANVPWADGSVAHVCMDPPYYDNVMYAELADYFYVWEKGTLGALVPEFFLDTLTDKENEAVANTSRFEAMGRRKKELADLDYETKMTAIFAEARRVLRVDGVLSVMFTHKRAEAWDTLGMGLLQAGFTIETSWPVNTEFENSLHQANMNSAASTIMLVCRKRNTAGGSSQVYLDDIEHDIRSAARAAAQRFQHDGIDGVDLLLSTYGPTLSVISQNWPVYSSVPDADGRDQLLRPEDALDLAREEVVQLRRARLVGKAAHVDDMTDFVLLAWDIFGAREFPYDTARLLALAVGGLDVDNLERAKIVKKKSGSVTLLGPSERLRRDADSELPGVRPEAAKFEYTIDAVDTALYIADVDGMLAAKRFLDRHGFSADSGFVSTVQGLVNAIPRTKAKGAWAVHEAGLLDTLCTLYLPTVTLPEAEDLAAPTVQGSLFGDE